jgi:uncharacterized DUF497 family protein
MNFEWDEQKRLSNVQKHGIDFVDAVDIFDGRARLDFASPRRSEHRMLSVGELDGIVIAVAWTHRGSDTVRIISVRRARRDEKKAYRETHG